MGLGSREHKEEQQDAGERKDDDFEQLQAAAMQRVNSKKVMVPTASRKNIQEVDVRKLTRSQKNRIIDAGLQVTVFKIQLVHHIAWRLLRNVKSGVLSNVVMPASCLLQQYYRGKGKWEYMPVVGFAKAFDRTEMAKTTRGSLAQPYQAPNPKCEEALITYKYALNGKSLTVHNFGSWSQQMHGTHHLLSLRILYRVVNLLVVHGKYSSE